VLGSSVDVGLAPPVDRCHRIRSWSAVDAGTPPPSVPHDRLDRAVVRCATGLRVAGGPGAAALW